MKTKSVLLLIFLTIANLCTGQYLIVKARYAETRLVDNAPLPPSRENRLILSFYQYNASGVCVPVALSNHDIWIYKEGLQYGSLSGGVLDSTGNNYPGYAMTAPKVVSYFNTYNPNYIDCSPNMTTQFTANGLELDCGFIRVSHWEEDIQTGAQSEFFTAPNVCLPYYQWPHPYAGSPGNLNFTWPVPPTPPYNYYSFACSQSTQQLVVRGVMPHDSGRGMLPVRFDAIRATIIDQKNVLISWTNLTETDINYYAIEKSINGSSFESIAIVRPMGNSGSRADYKFPDSCINTGERLQYRVKAVENNGNYLYSPVVSVRTSTMFERLKVFPNPINTTQLNLLLPQAAKGKYVVSLINATGVKTFLHRFEHPGGMMSMAIKLTNMPPGLYQLEVNTTAESYRQKILIQ